MTLLVEQKRLSGQRMNIDNFVMDFVDLTESASDKLEAALYRVFPMLPQVEKAPRSDALPFFPLDATIPESEVLGFKLAMISGDIEHHTMKHPIIKAILAAHVENWKSLYRDELYRCAKENPEKPIVVRGFVAQADDIKFMGLEAQPLFLWLEGHGSDLIVRTESSVKFVAQVSELSAGTN